MLTGFHEFAMLYFIIRRVVQGAIERRVLTASLYRTVPLDHCSRGHIPLLNPLFHCVRDFLAYVSTSIFSVSTGISCTLTNFVISSFLMIFSFSTAVVPLGNL